MSVSATRAAVSVPMTAGDCLAIDGLEADLFMSGDSGFHEVCPAESMQHVTIALLDRFAI